MTTSTVTTALWVLVALGLDLPPAHAVGAMAATDPHPDLSGADPVDSRESVSRTRRQAMYDGEQYSDLYDGAEELGQVKRLQPWYHLRYGGRSYPDTEPLLELSKRSDGYQLITYRCARKMDAICKNGGRGPKVTRLGKGLSLCACLCPYGFGEPRCERSWWQEN